MLFDLTNLNVERFLTEDAPKLKEDGRDIQVIGVVDVWKHSDLLCENYVVMDKLILCTIFILTIKQQMSYDLDRNIKQKMLGLRNLSWYVSSIIRW